jgi:translation initiation factor IF-2
LGIRVHTLAKELGVSSKDLIAKCQEKGLVRITKHMNSLSEGEARMLREELRAGGAPSAPKRPTSRRPAPRPGATRPKPPPKPTPAPPAEELPDRKKDRRKKDTGRDEKPRKKEGRKRGKPKGRGPKGSGMTFTDFTANGSYSDAIAGTGVDYQRRVRRPRPYGRRKRYGRTTKAKPKTEVPPEERKAELAYPVTVRDLSAAIGVKAGDIITSLMQNDVTATINQPIPNEMVEMVALEHGWEVTIKEQESVEEEVERAARAESEEGLQPRIPVVTMLGHVDHGKTSLLDYIRKTDVAESETAGITQHIGAYHVTTPEGKEVTFLDTPGHEAFTAMRARGAHCTDIVILVVAADDGVMPQTEEAISHAQAAEVPIVVALNKMDLPGADPARVKPQLGGAGLELEEWGGDIPCVEVSAATGQGIDDLIEMTLLVAELKDLKANPNKAATGVVLEAHMTEGRGPVATALVREGVLRVGDVVLCGATFGRVRTMHDDRGRSVDEAGPSIPVQLSGLSGLPEASDPMLVVEDLQKAREVAELREQRARKASLLERQHVTLENLFGTLEEGKAAEVRVILKADVKGSLEPLREKLTALSTDEVKIRILHAGVGAVNESDVLLADASDAIIIAYRVVADARIRRLAEDKKVDLRFYQVIFQPVDDMRAALSGLLEPERRETVIGHATVLQVFRHSRVGNIAGCRVTDGSLTKDCRVRVARDGVVIKDDGRIASLRRVKDDVRQVPAGQECGVKVADYDDIKEDDVIEAYQVEEIARTL